MFCVFILLSQLQERPGIAGKNQLHFLCGKSEFADAFQRIGDQGPAALGIEWGVGGK